MNKLSFAVALLIGNSQALRQAWIDGEYENEFSLFPSSLFLIPNATHAKAVLLIVVVAVYIGIVVVQFAVPSVVRIVLCTTPPVTVVANVVVISIVVAVPARKTS